MRFHPIDVTGVRIRAGSVVRVVGVPDLSGMAPKQRTESLPVFEYLVGRYKSVKGFNRFGLVELTFAIPGGELRGWHSVAIEPSLLRLRRKRKK
jgi:hypothetical protein